MSVEDFFYEASGTLSSTDSLLKTTKLVFGTLENTVGTLHLSTGKFEGDAEESAKMFWKFIEDMYKNTLFNRLEELEKENKQLKETLNVSR